MTDGWQRHYHHPILEMRPYVPGEDITGISTVYIHGAPKAGDLVVRHPEAPQAGMWFISGSAFTGYSPTTPSGQHPGAAVEPEPAFWPPGFPRRPTRPGGTPVGKKRTEA